MVTNKKLTFEEFTAALMPDIRKAAEESGNPEIRRETIDKLTGSYESISVYDKERSMGICINLNDLFEKYEDGATLENLADLIRENLAHAKNCISLEEIEDYEEMKDKLFIRVSNANANAHVLKNVPHLIYEEFAITAHLAVEVREESLSSALVTDQLLAVYGIRKEQLFADAKKNSVRLFPPAIFECGMDEEHCLCALTNEQKINGAAVMFYEGMLEELSDSFDCDLLVIPSSIHEMILVPYRQADQIDFYRHVLHDANRSCVNEGEALSENIYLIMRDEKILKRAD